MIKYKLTEGIIAGAYKEHNVLGAEFLKKGYETTLKNELIIKDKIQ